MAILKFKDENNQWQDLAALRGRDGVIQYQAGNGIVIDGNVISAIQQDLSNYYTKAQVNDLIDAIDKVSLEAVNELPATGEPGIIYLVPSANPQTTNAKDEYIYINNAWEQIGTTAVDLSNYYTKSEVDNLSFEHRWYTVETTLPRNQIVGYYQLRNEANDLSAAVTNAYADQEDILRIKFSYGKNGQSYEKGNEFVEFQHDDADLQTKPTVLVARYIGINGFAKQLVILGSWSGDVFTSTDSYMNMYSNDMETVFRDGATKQYVDAITGSLTDLDTTDKTSLVNAINEVAAGSGGGGGSDVVYTDLTSACSLTTSNYDTEVIFNIHQNQQATLYGKIDDIFTKLGNGETPVLLFNCNAVRTSFSNPNQHKVVTQIVPAYYYKVNNNWHIEISIPNTPNNQQPAYGIERGNSTYIIYYDTMMGSYHISYINNTTRLRPTYLDEVLTMSNTTSYTPSADYHPATKKYVDDSIPGVATTSADGLMSAADKTSLNDLVTAVGSVSSTDVTNWNTAATNSHTHANKTLLDTITSGDVSDWNGAVTNSHTHSNKTVLDGITAANITAWNKTHIYSGTSTPGAGTGENGDIYVKYTA